MSTLNFLKTDFSSKLIYWSLNCGTCIYEEFNSLKNCSHDYTYKYIYFRVLIIIFFLTFHSKPFDKTEDNIFSSMAFKKKLIEGLFVRDVNKIST